MSRLAEQNLPVGARFEFRHQVYVVLPEPSGPSRCEGCAFHEAGKDVCQEVPLCSDRIFMTEIDAVTYELTGGKV